MPSFSQRFPQIKYVPSSQDIADRIRESILPEEFLYPDTDLPFTPKELNQILPNYSD